MSIAVSFESTFVIAAMREIFLDCGKDLCPLMGLVPIYLRAQSPQILNPYRIGTAALWGQLHSYNALTLSVEQALGYLS